MIDKTRRIDFSAYSKLTILFLVVIIGNRYGRVDGLRMKAPAVTASSDILMVGVPARLTCNYLKFRSERIREITWYAGYNSMSQIYHHDVAGRQSQATVHNWITVVNGSDTETDLSVTLPVFRENRMTLKCEVKARREQGGRVDVVVKSGETAFNVADASSHQLMLKTGTPTASIQSLGRDRTATVGEQLIVSCLSIGSTQTPNLTLHANGQEFQNIYGGRVNLERYNQGDALVGYIDTVSNSLFNHANNLLIECKAWFGDHMFKKKNLNLTKRVSGRPRPVVPGPRPHYPSGGVFERHAEVVHGHLLEMMDPSRHVHPGIPYDFYSGYVVVESQNVGGQGNLGQGQERTFVLGQLPQAVRRELEQQYGKYQYVDNNKVIMKLNAVKVLNLLGSMDYRVIGTSSPDRKQESWTLEHKDFEKLKDLPNNDIDHLAHNNG